MFICFLKYAFFCNILSNLVFGEFKFNNTANECNIIDNEYCIHKPLKGEVFLLILIKCFIFLILDDCSVTIISPYSCASQQNDSFCDFFLDWSVINDDVAKFTLSKYNYQINEWIALIFSSSNISNTEVCLTMV